MVSKIRLLKGEEFWLLQELTFLLTRKKCREELRMVNEKQNALKNLVRTIALYPSIHEYCQEGTECFDRNSMIKSLCSKNEYNIIFNVPTKALLGKDFLIAKLNFFLLFKFLEEKIPQIKKMSDKITNVLFNIIFTMMAEEIFFDIIKNESLSEDLRKKAAEKLILLWEKRLDYGVDEFAPALKKIWQARESFCPAYGTLMGTSEMFLFSNKIHEDASAFLGKASLDENMQFALEEFLFGLSFEEMNSLREVMKRDRISVVSREEIEKILNVEKIYTGDKKSGPREFYSYFIRRQNHAKYRLYTKVPGPVMTFEEYYMLHLLEKS